MGKVLKGKAAVVTGSEPGTGKAIALTFAEQSAKEPWGFNELMSKIRSDVIPDNKSIAD